jgi:DNA polymerase I
MGGSPKSSNNSPTAKGSRPLSPPKNTRWGYDPRDSGALCDHCSLRGRPIVPSELRHGSIIDIVAEAPGHTEEMLGYPLVGPSGKEVEEALAESGLSRSQVSMINVMCCKAPEPNYDAHLRTLGARNKQRASRGLAPLLKPHEACLPRLMHELSHTRGMMLMGKYARRAILGVTADELSNETDRAVRASWGIEEGADNALTNPAARVPQRGFPGKAIVHGREVPVLSSVHPAFVLRQRRWTKIFRADVAKAIRMVRGQLSWIEPDMLFFPAPDELRAFLQRIEASGDPIAYDVETNALEPTEARLRCVGLGTKRDTTCVPFLSVETLPPWLYSTVDFSRIVEMLTNFFRYERGSLVAQNGKYDWSVMEHCKRDDGLPWFPDFTIKRKLFDTAIAHHVAWSEWPHDLDFMIAQYTDAPHHKGKNHDSWTSDRELHYYCMLDVARTAEISEHLVKDQKLLGQREVFKQDMRLSSFCRELGDIGMGLDVAERDRLFQVHTEIMDTEKAKARKLFQEALGRTGRETRGSRKLIEELNPGSFQQVGTVLYEILGVEPAPEKAGGYTESGALSTKSDTLYYLMDRGLPEIVELALLAVIDYRGAQKLRGTYCTVEPCKDGRVRSSWNPHVVVSGRLSGSAPNLMNLEHSIRSMYVAWYNHLLIACDKAQLEARITAWLARDWVWIRAFLDGADIHKVNAVDLLGIPDVRQVTKGQRQFTKTFVYAIQYLAGLKKAYQMIRNFVDPRTGERPYRTKSLSEIAVCFRRFWTAHKAIEEFHAANRRVQAACGYLQSAKQGRRRYFLDGGGDESIKEEMANYIIQSTAADDVNEATDRVCAEFPPGFAGPYTGVIHQCHDALTLEVPADRAVEIGARVVEIMYSKLGDMPLPVDLAIGKNYGNKTEYVKDTNGVWRPKE